VLADDFTIIHANGDLLTREEWFADLRSGATGWEQLDVHDIVARRASARWPSCTTAST
jgi:hypothetical protein